MSPVYRDSHATEDEGLGAIYGINTNVSAIACLCIVILVVYALPSPVPTLFGA